MPLPRSVANLRQVTLKKWAKVRRWAGGRIAAKMWIG
jgi:hypothetical protein